MDPQEGNGKPKEVVDNRQKMLDAAMKKNQHQPDALIEVLHTAQELYGFLQDDTLLYITKKLKLPPSKVYGVATFYNFFSLAPKGEHSCIVCMGTACYVKGAAEIVTAVEKANKIKSGDTTEDGKVTLLNARCVGACGIAPAVILDGAMTGYLTPDKVVDKVKEWRGNGSV
jgi:bidirectional [NiFe] hydrogenase diaphorase subunit